MNATGPESRKGLSPQHKAALTEALAMRSKGAASDEAVAHLVSSGMPRVVAKVLLNQYDRTSESTLLKHATQTAPAPM